jgi:hypothetical protein
VRSDWFLTDWSDHAAKEIRLVNLERVRDRRTAASTAKKRICDLSADFHFSFSSAAE